MTKPVASGGDDLFAQLQAARGDLAAAAAKSRALRQQALAEGVAQAASLAHQHGDGGLAGALGEEAERLQERAARQSLDVKA